MSIKTDRMAEIINDDDATRERVQTAHKLRMIGEATSTDYVAFRKRSRAAPAASHAEFMSLVFPQPESKVTPAEDVDLFDFDAATTGA